MAVTELAPQRPELALPYSSPLLRLLGIDSHLYLLLLPLVQDLVHLLLIERLDANVDFPVVKVLDVFYPLTLGAKVVLVHVQFQILYLVFLEFPDLTSLVLDFDGSHIDRFILD
jgi:hypothetical protein